MIKPLLIGTLFHLAIHAQVGIISTVAGSTPVDGDPVRGFSGDGGRAVNATLAFADVQNKCDPGRFEQGVHISVDASGNLYIADGANHRVRRVDKDGVMITVVGAGAPVNQCELTGSVGDNGSPLGATLFGPADVAVHPSGDLIIADQQNNRIRRASQSSITTIVGGLGHNLYSPNNPGTSSGMDWPGAVTVDANGTVYFAEVHSHRVARLNSDGRIVTVAGTGFRGFNGDDRAATTAQLHFPTGIAADYAGNVYIADQRNHRIRKVALSGIITTVAGNGQVGFSGDGGPATAARLNMPMDVKVDALGNIYIADTLNHVVRRVDISGTIMTIAGDGSPGRGPDNVIATESRLYSPAGLAIDSNNDVYIADWQNYLVRKVSFRAVSANAIVNAASFTAASGLAPGTIITLAGLNFANSTGIASAAPLPTSLEGASVDVNGRLVPLFFVSADQINAQLPFDLDLGDATLTVRSSSGVGSTHRIRIVPSSPGIFQLDGAGRAAALNQDNSVNSSSNPEARGSVITLFLTGMGVVEPLVVSGETTPGDVLRSTPLPVSASIGGKTAEILFAGMTPGSIGLAQVNVRIPSDTSTGIVPATITIGESTSNVVTIAVR